MSETRERSALEVLRSVEWVQDEYGGWCPICDMEEDQGHAPDCALDAVLRATPAADSYWWCPECREEVDGSRVTWQEIHDHCGTRVESRATPASDGGEVRERVGEALKQFDDIRWADVIAALPADLGMWTWKYLRYVRSDLVAALELLGVEVEEGDPLASIPAAILSASGTPQGEGEALVPDAMDRGCDCSGCDCGNVGDAESVGYADGWNACRQEMLAALRSAPSGVEKGESEWEPMSMSMAGVAHPRLVPFRHRPSGVVAWVDQRAAARLRGEGGGE